MDDVVAAPPMSGRPYRESAHTSHGATYSPPASFLAMVPRQQGHIGI